MKKPIAYLISLILLLTLTGCFEIREEINMKADGSGEATMVFDLSKSKGKLKQYMKMEKVENYRVPSEVEIESFLYQVKSSMRMMKDITYVETKSDWSNFIFRITARFDNVDALNEAIAGLSEQMKHLEIPPVTTANYHYEKGRFSRHFDYPTKPQEFAALPSMQRFMLETSNAISIYRFEKKVKNISNKMAMISPSGKAVMLKMPLSELITGQGTLTNSIEFDN